MGGAPGEQPQSRSPCSRPAAVCRERRIPGRGKDPDVAVGCHQEAAPLPAHAEEPAHVLAHKFCLSSASICRSGFLMLMSMLCSLLFVFFKTRQFYVISENTSVLFFFFKSSNEICTQFHGTLFFDDEIQIASCADVLFVCVKDKSDFFKTKDGISGLKV